MRILLVVLLVACSSKSTPPSTTNTTPVEQGSGSNTGSAEPSKGSDGPGIGENCGPDGECRSGLECVKYYGIAGARGPEFKTCEVRCSGKGSTCPTGTTCATIADGPGQVCR